MIEPTIHTPNSNYVLEIDDYIVDAMRVLVNPAMDQDKLNPICDERVIEGKRDISAQFAKGFSDKLREIYAFRASTEDDKLLLDKADELLEHAVLNTRQCVQDFFDTHEDPHATNIHYLKTIMTIEEGDFRKFQAQVAAVGFEY